MPITKLTPENNYPYQEDRLKALEQAVPEAFTDGKINWDTLRDVLGEELEDPREEFFGLSWPGKREARQLASIPSRGALVPVPGEGVNEDETENLFIEGDNLEVLKLLLKSYAGKIKMIYIDPPYNTGNDFIYNDHFSDPLEAYLKYTGAKDEGGELLTTNTRADGRFHSRWLNMMYPRLILARQLLREDGVIFISIDDNEVHNLRQIMNEVFGEENFIGIIGVLSNPKGRSQDKYLATCHEYVVGFSKSTLQTGSLSISKTDEDIENDYPLVDEFGPYRELELRNTHREFGKHNRPNLFYPFYIRSTGQISFQNDGNSKPVYPVWNDGYKGCWTWGMEKAKNEIEYLVAKLVNENWKIYRKDYAFKNGEKSLKQLKSLWLDNKYTTEKGQASFNELFNSREKIFQSPKSVELIKDLIRMSQSQNDYILDFFCGSGTTAHSILDLNKEVNKNNKFILIQLKEPTEHHEFQTIPEISKERIRKAIKKIELEKKAEVEKSPLFQNNEQLLDLGFKVFKLSQSNYKFWKTTQKENLETLATLFDDQSNPLKQSWIKEDLMSEVLLLEGFPLTSKIEIQDDFLQNQLYHVTTPDFCTHSLFVCLDEQVHPNTVELLKMEKEDIFICLDNALSDEMKATLQDRFNVHVI